MISLDNYQSLKRKVAELQQQKSKAEGALGQLMKRLRKEYGCKTIKEAKALLEKFIKVEQTAAAKYLKAKKDFEKKWEDQLTGN